MVYMDTLTIMDSLKKYSSPKSKITRMIKNGEIIQIRRGLYIKSEEKNFSLKTIANKIYGPSYISFEYALYYYGFIPERADTLTSAAFNKNKNKIFHTPVGNFLYRRIPNDVYPLEIIRVNEEHNPFLIATKEKAICDTLYLHKDISSFKNLEKLLLNDLRIDENMIQRLDKKTISKLAPFYKVKVAVLFSEWISRRYLYE